MSVIQINRPARQRMWVDTYRDYKRRQRRLGWLAGILFLTGIGLAAWLLDSGILR